ncbi:MAG: D-aminoacyl-tRNA deacylase, partial [Rhodobacteraceae bacterium]|nr:D-aminoacyl-tRNA deacylase [Paracoccaceae bacterium]
MRALIQRVTRASVSVDGTDVGACGPGLMILVCAMQGDGPDKARAMADKILKLRI